MKEGNSPSQVSAWGFVSEIKILLWKFPTGLIFWFDVAQDGVENSVDKAADQKLPGKEA